MILPNKPLLLDQAVDFLRKEDEYAEKECKTPHLWQASEKETLRSQQRHVKKRRTLKHYLDRTASSEVQSETVDIWDLDEPSSDIRSCSGRSLNSDNEDDIIDMSGGWSQTDVSAAEPANKPPVSTNSETHSSDTRKRKKCLSCSRVSIINKSCSTHSCAPCCYASTQYCKPHNTRKLGAPKSYMETMVKSPPSLQGLEDRLEAAMEKRQSVYILYAAQDDKVSFRKITPETFQESKNGRKVRAHCHLKNEPRSFFLHSIQRIEGHDWNSPPATVTPGTKVHFFRYPHELIFFLQ